mmetsp:Transcript_35869/g.75475  ORF Transcript_35869/g.75475 Transcript_35869/m.75475 type:complete len:393 (-) Transcript_35869:341-1519(-)
MMMLLLGIDIVHTSSNQMRLMMTIMMTRKLSAMRCAIRIPSPTHGINRRTRKPRPNPRIIKPPVILIRVYIITHRPAVTWTAAPVNVPIGQTPPHRTPIVRTRDARPPMLHRSERVHAGPPRHDPQPIPPLVITPIVRVREVRPFQSPRAVGADVGSAPARSRPAAAAAARHEEAVDVLALAADGAVFGRAGDDGADREASISGEVSSGGRGGVFVDRDEAGGFGGAGGADVRDVFEGLVSSGFEVVVVVVVGCVRQGDAIFHDVLERFVGDGLIPGGCRKLSVVAIVIIIIAISSSSSTIINHARFLCGRFPCIRNAVRGGKICIVTAAIVVRNSSSSSLFEARGSCRIQDFIILGKAGILIYNIIVHVDIVDPCYDLDALIQWFCALCAL